MLESFCMMVHPSPLLYVDDIVVAWCYFLRHSKASVLCLSLMYLFKEDGRDGTILHDVRDDRK